MLDKKRNTNATNPDQTLYNKLLRFIFVLKNVTAVLEHAEWLLCPHTRGEGEGIGFIQTTVALVLLDSFLSNYLKLAGIYH